MSYLIWLCALFILSEEFDAYIIVSFVNATLVLSIGETVEEVTESGFLGITPTLSCSALGDDALVQVFIECSTFFFLHCKYIIPYCFILFFLYSFV